MDGFERPTDDALIRRARASGKPVYYEAYRTTRDAFIAMVDLRDRWRDPIVTHRVRHIGPPAKDAP